LKGKNKMSDKTSIFASENNESPVQTIRQTMSVSLSGEGTPLVSFATNRGKGSGAQAMPVADFAEVISVLQECSDNGIEEREEEHLSPADTIRRTIRLEDGVISFRTKSGKGSKPAKIPAGMFGEVVELLSGTLPAVQGAATSLTGSDADEASDDE
tara:strand:+ start:1022 stop:1489 length:468 start_codon:yes stop_codon:yes gene_type:complete